MLSDDGCCRCELEQLAAVRPGVWLLSGRGGVSGSDVELLLVSSADGGGPGAPTGVKPPPLLEGVDGSVLGARSMCGECMAGLCCMLAAAGGTDTQTMRATY